MKYFIVILLLSLFFVGNLDAQGIPRITVGVGQTTAPKDVATSMQILLLLTVLSIAPSILIMMTCFTRISIVLSFVRKAVGTAPAPSNQIIAGLSLFLTFFIMAPIFNQMNDKALQPYLRGEMTHQQAYTLGIKPLRDFMLKQTRDKDLALMINSSRMEKPDNADAIPLHVIVPAFCVSEIRIAFEMGFLIYLPFLMIDMIVASILMSMGMMMLPPAMISAPLKILLFILVDGWYLVIQSLVKSFNW